MMIPKYQEVDPNLVWQKGKKAEDIKMYTGGDAIKPWSDLRELPEFSYKTSYQIGLPHFYQFKQYYEPPAKADLTKKEEGYKYEIYKGQYSTTTGSTYTFKTIKPEPGEKPSFLDYIDHWKQQFQVKLQSLPSGLSEYRTKYKLHPYDPKLAGEINAQVSDTIRMAKQTQPSCPPAAKDTRVTDDMYISQTQQDHQYFPQEKKNVSLTTITPEPELPCNPYLIPFDPPQRVPFRQVTLRKKVGTVPHRGMVTEFQDNYKPQVDTFIKYDTEFDLEPIYMRTNEKESMIKQMDRYHTEYDHIGHNWSTQNI